MTEIVLPKDLLALLQTVDTPTVCNAIEVVQPLYKGNYATF
jgi:hypothetical protein